METFGLGAEAAGLSVTETATIPVSTNRTWAVVGDFGGLHVWHPWTTRDTRLTATNSRSPGAIRVQQFTENCFTQDRLVEWDGTRKTLRYSTDSTTLPVTNVESTLSVTNNLDGRPR